MQLKSVLWAPAKSTTTLAACSRIKMSTSIRTIKTRRASVARFTIAAAAVYQATRFKSCSVWPARPHTISSASEPIGAPSNLPKSSFCAANMGIYGKRCRGSGTDLVPRIRSPATPLSRRSSSTRDIIISSSRCKFELSSRITHRWWITSSRKGQARFNNR